MVSNYKAEKTRNAFVWTKFWCDQALHAKTVINGCGDKNEKEHELVSCVLLYCTDVESMKHPPWNGFALSTVLFTSNFHNYRLAV